MKETDKKRRDSSVDRDIRETRESPQARQVRHKQWAKRKRHETVRNIFTLETETGLHETPSQNVGFSNEIRQETEHPSQLNISPHVTGQLNISPQVTGQLNISPQVT